MLEFRQLLVGDRDVPQPIREAIVAGEIRTAGELLIEGYGLDCVEASLLLDAPLCEPEREQGDCARYCY